MYDEILKTNELNMYNLELTKYHLRTDMLYLVICKGMSHLFIKSLYCRFDLYSYNLIMKVLLSE